MNDPHKPWDLDTAVGYYKTQRHALADLYESERVFFPSVMSRSSSVLDVGCAAGGTASIIHAVNPRARYVGVDISPAMVAAAQTLFPSLDFRLTAGNRLDFPDGAFDTVLALGVLNHVPDYPALLREMLRVASGYVLVDLPRLVPHAHVFDAATSHMVLKQRFGDGAAEAAPETRVPYVVADAAEAIGLLAHEPGDLRVLVKGYFGAYNPSVVCPYPQLCFAVACIQKNGGGGLTVDLPAPIRTRLAEADIAFTEPFERLLA